MNNKNWSRRHALKHFGALGAAGLVAGSSPLATSQAAATPRSAADLDLSDPVKRSTIITKIMGAIGKQETHAFMRFHVYGFTGTNSMPFFSMNNYVVQRWTPLKPGSYQLAHYEVGYWTEFDTDKPITHWNNPITGETVELETFILGPIPRTYTPDGIIAPGIAPNPLRVNVIGDRVYVPAQSIESFPNMFPPKEWPEYSNQDKVYWDSFYTYSASIDDVLDANKTSAPAIIQMQNLASWQPFLKLGRTPGRTMARAFGNNISGFDALPKNILSNFKKFTPEIFATDTWTETRFDNIDYYRKMQQRRAKSQQKKG